MHDVPSPRALIRFGGFELDIESRELLKRGVKVRLQEQPFQILQVLLEQPGRVVSREELQRRIWPSDTFVDFDRGLYNAIKKLREYLDDSAESPVFIETLSRRGYRFIAEVTRDEGVVSRAAAQASIAVLPFINMSADAENEFFADGITEEIINVLSQIEGLHVAARTSTFFFKGKHADMRQIGEQLNVRTLLEGSVRKLGGRLRITAQLVNVADGYHLWSEQYDRELKDVFAIQDEIARSIAERLKLTLEGDRPDALVKAGTKNLEAYQFFLKGQVLHYRRGAAIPQAAECFERAVKLDPGYALAWAGMADSYTTLGYYGLAPPVASMPKAMEAARRAVTLDPSLADAHTALAMAALMGAWDKREAEHGFLRALQLNPKYIQARDWYALFYLQFFEGRLGEGMAEAKLALESDPLSSYAHTIYSLTSANAGNLSEAVRASRRVVELDPASYLARGTLQAVLHMAGLFEESVAVAESALTMSGRHSWSMAVLSVTLADWGKTTDAEAVYAEMMARVRRQYMPPALLAVAASAARRDDEAIRHAREALEIRDPACRLYFSKYFVYSRRLYAYTQFRELLLKVSFE
ncbi:MAG TPA: winged helix-turn-helix domain-containing protein [Candidatus Sulfotelmatobacter sp.]|nr:winged helix-turn-helix domain-containing protein [Candidatus Sulfotelmatobacter sp.]